MIAAAEIQTFWIIALGIGAVAVLVVIVLMSLMLTLLRDVEKGVGKLIRTADQVAANTESVEELEATGPVLEQSKEW